MRPYPPIAHLPQPWPLVFEIINALHKYGVPVVVSGGNDGWISQDTNKYPALFATYTTNFPPVFVAGAVNLQGIKASFSQNLPQPYATFWAPGVEVACAGMSSDAEMVYRIGTSFSASMV